MTRPGFQMIRRSVLAGAACAAAALLLVPGAARAQMDLKIMAPAAAGGGWDSTARTMSDVLTKTGGASSVQVTNVPGAGGTVGLAQFVNEAKGDGGQLLVGGMVMVGAILTNQAPVTLDQVTPIARLTGEPLVVVVKADSPITDVAALSTALKDNTAATVIGGGSAGGADHILAALLVQAAGADPATVNYLPFSGGGEALAAILGGQVAAGISGYSEFAGQIASGELRALGISSKDRVPGIEVATLAEQGIDIDLVNWRGVFAGPELADADKAALDKAIADMVASDDWKAVLAEKGWADFYMPAADFGPFIGAENERVSGILKSIGLVQ